MLSLKLKSVAALALALSINASAQNLSTEVVVERSVQPTERAASRLNGLTPTLVLPKVQNINLSTANYNGISEISRGYTPYESDNAMLQVPAADDSRGYAVLGYFPTYNIGISAGYQLIENDDTNLGIWGQFCGESYEPEEELGDMEYNGGRVGMDFSKIFRSGATIEALLRYQYAESKTNTRSSQDLNSGDFFARWTSSSRNLTLGVGAGFDSYSDFEAVGFYAPFSGLNEIRFELDGGMFVNLGNGHRAGVDANFSYGNSLGELCATPYYSVKNDKFGSRIGIDLDVSLLGDNAINFEPDVEFYWTPSAKFAAKASVTGGVFINTMNRVREISPYLPGTIAYGRSRVPVDAQLNLTINPFAGFSAELFGGYAIAEDWLMPDEVGTLFSPMMMTDIEGWHAGIRLNYAHKWLEFGASAETAASDNDKAYYLWRDRAKYVFNVFAQAAPIERLTVDVDYEFRSGRHTTFTSLGCVSNLSLGASYQFTPKFSVFIQGENLLARKYQELPGLYSQSIHGLCGLSLKF